MITADNLRLLLRRPISFYRVFAEVAGSATAGLFLSQLFYWSDKGDDPDGWIYKTQEKWTEETCLTRSEQERARKTLRDIGLLEETRRGIPSRLFYRLNIDQLASMLDRASLDAGSRKQLASKQDQPDKDARSSDLSLYTETTTETTQKDDPSLVQLETDDIFAARLRQLRRKFTGNAAAWQRLLDSATPGDPSALLARIERAVYEAQVGRR